MRAPIVATTLSLGLVSLLLLIFFMEEIPWWLDEDTPLMEQHCGACHGAQYPRSYAKPPRAWRETVEQMLTPAHGPPRPVSAEHKARLTALLQRHRSADGETLFNRRCSRCHDADVLEPYLALDKAALSLLLRQHADQNNHAVQVWELRLIEPVVMARRAATRPPKAEAAAQLTYEHACGSCHTVRFRYHTLCGTVPDGGWDAVIRRMRQKAPLLIPQLDLPGLTARARAICASGGGPLPSR